MSPKHLARQSSSTGPAPRSGHGRSRKAGPSPSHRATRKRQDGTAVDTSPHPTGAASARRRKRWREWPVTLGVALILALGIKTFFVQAFSIPSLSMQDTLQRGDRVLVDKFTPWFGATPQRGEVVVFRDPGGWLPEHEPTESNPVLHVVRSTLGFLGLMPSADEKDLIKRVIAVGGDTVECSSGSPVKVNGMPLREPYIYRGATPCDDLPVGTVKVPKGYLWVMGDHRNDSWDSRAHIHEPGGGFVPVDHVIGRAFAVVWPIHRAAALPAISLPQR